MSSIDEDFEFSVYLTDENGDSTAPGDKSFVPLATFLPSSASKGATYDVNESDTEEDKNEPGRIAGIEYFEPEESSSSVDPYIENGVIFIPSTPLASYQSSVDAVNRAGLIYGIEIYSSIDAPEILDGKIRIPSSSVPLASYSSSYMDPDCAGTINGIKMDSDIETPKIERGFISIPQRLASYSASSVEDHAGLLTGIAFSDIEAACISEGFICLPYAHHESAVDKIERAGVIIGIEYQTDDTIINPVIDSGMIRIPRPSVPLANYNSLYSMFDNEGLIREIAFSAIESPAIEDGKICLPYAHCCGERNITGAISGVLFSSVDTPQIYEGNILLPESLNQSGGLPGIWTKDDTLASVSGVESSDANEGGYIVPWASILAQGNINGVECGNFVIEIPINGYYTSASMTMYANISPEGYIRFNFIQAE